VSQSEKPVILIRLRIAKTCQTLYEHYLPLLQLNVLTYAALVRQLANIQTYPTLRDATALVTEPKSLVEGVDVCEKSLHAAITDEITCSHGEILGVFWPTFSSTYHKDERNQRQCSYAAAKPYYLPIGLWSVLSPWNNSSKMTARTMRMIVKFLKMV
jgi:hypothetical protein